MFFQHWTEVAHNMILLVLMTCQKPCTELVNTILPPQPQ